MKKVCQITCIWKDTLGLKYEPLTCLKFFWLSLQKLWFLKHSCLHINRNFILCPPLLPIVAAWRPPDKTGFFTCLSCVGAGVRSLFFWGGAKRRGDNLAGLLSPWQAAHPIFFRSGQLSCPRGPTQNQFFSGPRRWSLWIYFEGGEGWARHSFERDDQKIF
jgi:hypothetical protein